MTNMTIPPSFLSNIWSGQWTKAESWTTNYLLWMNTHNEFSRSAKARISLLNARLTVASAKRTIWRLQSRMEDENGERKSKSGGIEGMRKSQRVGWACQLVDILNGKLPRPSLQSAATSEGQERRPAKRELACIYRICPRSFPHFS